MRDGLEATIIEENPSLKTKLLGVSADINEHYLYLKPAVLLKNVLSKKKQPDVDVNRQTNILVFLKRLNRSPPEKIMVLTRVFALHCG